MEHGTNVEERPAGAAGVSAGEAEVVAYLRGRSAPCPRCGYDLRDIQAARCPECGEPLVLKVGSPRAHFGWFVLAVTPGCFSGVAALFLMVPIGVSLWQRLGPGQGAPWQMLAADAFGFASGASVVMMYRHRQRIMSWRSRRQGAFAAGVWGVHVLALALLVFTIWFLG